MKSAGIIALIVFNIFIDILTRGIAETIIEYIVLTILSVIIVALLKRFRKGPKELDPNYGFVGVFSDGTEIYQSKNEEEFIQMKKLHPKAVVY